jgi:hypothetical protein
MSKDDIVKLVQSLNDGLDVHFLETLSTAELNGYVEHLKAVRMRTRPEIRRELEKIRGV